MSAPSLASQYSGSIGAPSSSFDNPPDYIDSPISPAVQFHRSLSQSSYPIESPVSPFNESLNIPIPAISRMSIDLPIPVNTPSLEESATDNRSDVSSLRLNTPSAESHRSASVPSISKLKSPSRTVRIANSIRRKPTIKKEEEYPLPKDPTFVFSASGHSLLLWGKGGEYLVRFDIPSSGAASIQGCKYAISGIEAAAAGNHKCVIIAANGLKVTRQPVIITHLFL